MKIRYLYIMLIFLFAACKKDDTVETPVFDVKVESATYKAGEEVEFKFSGSPNMISFYSGELLHDYEFREGRVVEAGKLELSFSTSVVFGTQADQLSVWASTDFNGQYQFDGGIFSATWVEITDRFKFGTGSTYVSSGKVDVSDLRKEGKPLYIAFKYRVRNQNATSAGGFGVGRTWRIQNFSLTSQTSLGLIELGDMTTSGFQLVDLKPEEAPARTTRTAAVISMVAHNVNAPFTHLRPVESENWAITTAFDVGSKDLGPDRPVAVKGIQDGEIKSFSHIFSKPGNYKVYFKAINATIKGSKEVVKEISLTITP